MNERLATLQMVTLAASVLLPSTLHAATPTRAMGSTSQATIGLSLSVRPRIAVARDMTAAKEGRTLETQGLCVRSTSALLRLTVTLQPLSQDPGLPGSNTTLAADTVTRPGIACVRNPRGFLGASHSQSRQSLFLLVAPD